MKKLLFALFLLPIFCLSQTPYDSTKLRQTQSAYGFDWNNVKFKYTIIIGLDTPRLARKDSGAIAYKGGTLWAYTGTRWSASYTWDSTTVYQTINELIQYIYDTSFTNQFMPAGTVLDTTYFVTGTQDSVRAYAYTDGTVIYDTLGTSLLTSITNNITNILNILDSVRSDTSFYISTILNSDTLLKARHDPNSRNDTIFFTLVHADATHDGYVSAGVSASKVLHGDGTWRDTTAIVNFLDTAFQWSVLDSLSTPPVSPSIGDKYLVGTSPTGAFVGHANQIATKNTTVYTFQSATVGDLLFNATTGIVSKWTGTVWLRVGRPIIHQGGDRYGVPIAIGSNDGVPLYFKTNNSIAGELSYYNGGSNFTVYNTAGSNAYLRADGNNRAQLGLASYGSYTTIDADGIMAVRPNAIWDIRGNNPANDNIIMSRALASGDGNVLGLRYTPTGGDFFRTYLSVGNYVSTGIGFNVGIYPSAILNLETTNQGLLFPRMTLVQRDSITRIVSGTIAGGSGYSNGLNQPITFTGGTGTGATGNVDVVGGIITIVRPYSTGEGYLIGDVLSTSDLGAGTGFTYTITQKEGVNGLTIYQTDNTPGLRVYDGSVWQSAAGGGGSGNTNSNIGSGYRWAIPGTNNIKTIFAGTNITIDSTTNANGLTINASGSTTTDKQTFTATASQTAFTVSGLPSSENDFDIYINGAYINPSYYSVSGTTLTFSSGLALSDNMEYARKK